MFIIFFFFFGISKQEIIFPFEITNTNSSEYITNILNKNLTTYLKIGTPIQKLKCSLQSEQFLYYISDENETRIYNSSQSSSYNDTNSSIITFMEGPIEKGLIANETFNFDFYDNNSNISVEHFNIILSKAHKFEKKTFPCSIGIGNRELLSSINQRNLIFNLYEKNIIENISYYFNFKEDNKGEFIIGGYPHIIEKEKYEKATFIKVKAKEQRDSHWNSEFIYFYGKDNITSYEFTTSFNPNLNGIICPNNNLQKKINETLFQKYIEEKKCVNESYNYYIFYHCDKDTKLDYDSLKNIFLYNAKLNYTFEIDHKKLFEEYNNRIYYLVIFGGKKLTEWTLGIPFLKTYTTVFTFDKNDSTFNQTNIIGFEIFPKEEEEHKTWVIITLILILIIIIIILLSIFISFWKKKKLKDNIEFDTEKDTTLLKN